MHANEAKGSIESRIELIMVITALKYHPTSGWSDANPAFKLATLIVLN